jgi:hypothetical protein
MSSHEVARTLRLTGVKPFPRSGMFAPRVGLQHVSARQAALRASAKYARSRFGTCLELTLPASWKKDSQ